MLFLEISLPVSAFLNDVSSIKEESLDDVHNILCNLTEVCFIPENIYKDINLKKW